MKLQKIARVLLISISAYCVTACNYLDVVPPETADYEHTMKDENAVRGFLYSCYAAVSYTHLDVYKRQVRGRYVHAQAVSVFALQQSINIEINICFI